MIRWQKQNFEEKKQDAKLQQSDLIVKRNCTFWIPKDPARAYYKFDCDFDPNTRTLKGNVIIQITNQTHQVHEKDVRKFVSS